jgi:DNA-binding transcriptional LysR family regulator
MVDLNDIGLFVQVVRHGSFSQAGRRLGMPSNTVSRRIQQLEARLGVRLMHRSTRRLSLTDAGRTLHERCAAAVDGLEDAVQDLIAGSRTPSGTVRVALPADFFDFYDMAWVAEFLDAYPLVQLDFVLSDATTDLIAEGIDVAFRGGTTPNPDYVVRQISSGSTGLVASPAYLAAHGTPATLKDLEQHDCVTASRFGGPVTWRLQGPDGAEAEVLATGRCMANTAQGLRKATLAGLGIALLPRVADVDIAAGLLVPVLPQYRRANQNLCAVYPSRRLLPLAVSAFIESVVDKLNAKIFDEPEERLRRVGGQP